MTTSDSTRSTDMPVGNWPVPGATSTAALGNASRPLDQYSFFQALRQIERQRTTQPRIGYARRPVDEPVRIGQPAELTFAPASLTGQPVIATPSMPAAHERVERGGVERPIHLQQRFLGLLGPAGPMPLHITEAVRDRARHAGDESLQAFLDIFHHRIATLFYRAWSDAQPAVQHDRPQTNKFARWLGAVAGVRTVADESSLGNSLQNIQRYAAGHFLGTHRHAEGLQSVLAFALNAPARVHPFALRTLWLSLDQRSQLSSRQFTSPATRRTNCLGQSAQLGAAVPDRTSMIDIEVGPVGYQAFESYLPGGKARALLSSLVRHYAGPAVDARVTIRLQANEVPKAVLGQSGQLGRSAWIAEPKAPRDRSDYRFESCGAAAETDSSREDCN